MRSESPLPPSRPVHRIGPLDLKRHGGVAVHENDEVRRSMAGAGNEQTVKFQEMRGCRESLGRMVIERFIAGDVHAVSREANEVRQVQRALGFSGDFMNFMLHAAWPNRFEREPEPNLGERSISFQTGIERLDSSARTPAPVGDGASDWVATGPCDTPDRGVDRRRVRPIESIQNRSIMNPPRHSQG
jgi:hypothetical protein